MKIAERFLEAPNIEVNENNQQTKIKYLMGNLTAGH